MVEARFSVGKACRREGGNELYSHCGKVVNEQRLAWAGTKFRRLSNLQTDDIVAARSYDSPRAFLGRIKCGTDGKAEHHSQGKGSADQTCFDLQNFW